MLKTLHDLLPPGAKLANLDPFMTKANTGPGHHYVELQYDDGGGASTVMLEFSSKQGRQLPRIDCSHWAGGGDEGPRKPGNEKPSCQVIQLPDGGSVDAYITGTDSVGLYDQSVRLYRADGTMLAVTAANATLNQYDGNQDDLITVTRDRPPLGLAGWEALLRSPKWQFKVDQATLDAGVAFAKTVTRFPCSPDVKPAECRID